MDIPEIDVEQLTHQLATGAAVFDVRELDEWTDVHIEGVTLISLADVPDSVDRFPTDRPVYVLCAKGGRSAQAVEFLRSRDVDAVNVAGGMSAWLASGQPATSA